MSKKAPVRDSKISDAAREWLVRLYQRFPILYLDEAKEQFENFHGISISRSSISLVLRNANMSWKVLERRAIQLNVASVVRFARELTEFPWILDNLVFLDEVSFDNRDMLRKRGWYDLGELISYCNRGVKGKSVIYRGEFTRKPRVSLLCFIGRYGLLETFHTEGFNLTSQKIHFTAKFVEFTLQISERSLDSGQGSRRSLALINRYLDCTTVGRGMIFSIPSWPTELAKEGTRGGALFNASCSPAGRSIIHVAQAVQL